MDFSSLLGILFGIGCVLLAQGLEGGSPAQLFQLSAFVIVFGGTLGAVLLAYSGSEVRIAISLLKDVFFMRKVNYQAQITELVDLAFKARKEGIISLEKEAEMVKDPLLKLGLEIVSNGADPSAVKNILEAQLEKLEERIYIGSRIFESAGGYAPTIGILGAVIGLIQVMQSLTNPSKLGSGIAVAFVSTVYGVGLANLILLPIANKIKMKHGKVIKLKELIIEGLLSIQAGESPVFIEKRLKMLIDLK